jgi:hypothetical protein
MIPMRTSSIFKSRWMALLWAAGIIWFALDVAGSPPKPGKKGAASDEATDVTGATVTNAEMRKVAGLLRDH